MNGYKINLLGDICSGLNSLKKRKRIFYFDLAVSGEKRSPQMYLFKKRSPGWRFFKTKGFFLYS